MPRKSKRSLSPRQKSSPPPLFQVVMILIVLAVLLVALFLKNRQAVLQSASCPLGSPNTSKWAPINRWDSYVVSAIEQVYQVERVRVPGNRIKAHMYIETGGTGNPNAYQRNPYGDAYGLMQITRNAWVVDRLDFSRIMDPAYNIYAGTLELAVRYKQATCGKGWDGASYGYFGGDPCGFGLSDPISGYTPARYHTQLQELLRELDNAGCTTAPSSPLSPTIQPTAMPTAVRPTQIPSPVPTFHCLGGCPTPTAMYTPALTPAANPRVTIIYLTPGQSPAPTGSALPPSQTPDWVADLRARLDAMRQRILDQAAALRARFGIQ